MRMQHSRLCGHLLALFTVCVWGTTFIASKILLADFTPAEIMFFRLIIAIVLLFAIHPHPIRPTSLREEGLFLIAGFFGVTLYFFCENTALVYTYASNVGILISAVPFFTGLAIYAFLREDKPTRRFFLGFAVAMAGAALVALNGAALSLDPFGDFLVLLAALCWSIYSVAYRVLCRRDINTVDATRRIFLYSLVTMLPLLLHEGSSVRLERFANMKYLAAMLFLGVLGSAICFVTWNTAMTILGTASATAYLYAQPIPTLLASAIVLDEKITPLALVGTLLILTGLVLSQKKQGG